MTVAASFTDVFGPHRSSPQREAQWRELEFQRAERERWERTRAPLAGRLISAFERRLPVALIAHAHSLEDAEIHFRVESDKVQIRFIHPDMNGPRLPKLELDLARGTEVLDTLSHLVGVGDPQTGAREGWVGADGVCWLRCPGGEELRVSLRLLSVSDTALSLNTISHHSSGLFSDQQLREADLLPLGFRLLDRGV